MAKFEQAVEERRKWARFGDALKAGEQQSVTAQSTDEIPFERVRQQKQTQEERKQDLKNVLQGSDKGAIVSKYAFPESLLLVSPVSIS